MSVRKKVFIVIVCTIHVNGHKHLSLMVAR